MAKCISPNGVKRIVITGGPGAGKTTAVDLFRREFAKRVCVVPEAATILYAGGFPRSKDPTIKRCIQGAIFSVQRGLEDIYARSYPGRVLICDRGTLDGLAYWPESEDTFFSLQETSLKQEIDRYTAVIFFESAAVGKMDIEGGNAYRVESLDEAVELDKKLKTIWSRHPNFSLVPHSASFFQKLDNGLKVIKQLLTEIGV